MRSLSIVFKYNDIDIARIYYPDNGYTYSALNEIKYIIERIKKYGTTLDDVVLSIIKYCENNGGGILNGEFGGELAYIKDRYPDVAFNQFDFDKYYGLVAITKKGMKELSINTDMNIFVYIDKEIVKSTDIVSKVIFDHNEELYDSKEDVTCFDFDRIDRVLRDVKVSMSFGNKFKHENKVFEIIR